MYKGLLIIHFNKGLYFLISNILINSNITRMYIFIKLSSLFE